MDFKYDCGKHNNEILYPNWKRAMYAISNLAIQRNIPVDACEHICALILLHRK